MNIKYIKNIYIYTTQVLKATLDLAKILEASFTTRRKRKYFSNPYEPKTMTLLVFAVTITFP